MKTGATKTEASYLAQIGILNKEKATQSGRIKELERQVLELQGLAQKDAKELEARIANLTRVFAKEIAAGEIQVKRFRNVLVIEIQDSVLFPPDSPLLIAKNLGVLLTLADVVRKAPDRILRVEGNTAVAISRPETLRLYHTS